MNYRGWGSDFCAKYIANIIKYNKKGYINQQFKNV